MAGVSGHSTRQALEFLEDAAAAGADYGLLLPAAYFGATAAVVDSFFGEVAAASPLPIVLYNFPGVCNGVDLASADIARLARAHPGRIVGVKLTCGSVAKITRLAAEFSPAEFAVFGGQADFLVGGLAAGSAGCIAAFANIAPSAVSRVYRLWTEGSTDEAMRVHRLAALAEQSCKGVARVKLAAAVVAAAKGLSVDAIEAKMQPRKPYPGLGDGEKSQVREALAALLKEELVDSR
jgi:2-keto-3-deoxy-L-rhamnonate aldolase